ncbi:glycosyltransferase family 4 protein [Olleya sp. ITB9]|uniref:glycosyltransferase family 4 protein n=1 Tax=Olleya sp. ITB9 TaxID=1715648 RepID=UPI0006D254E3|nr:glycosyltransferase family 4 protein [Olleya sp. ITB9]
MELGTNHIAIICNYKLLDSRVGGMDYFFWAFNRSCQDNNIRVDWFFPNTATHGQYNEFHIIESNSSSLQAHFIKHVKTTQTTYTHVITHFVELCTSFHAEVKQLLRTKVIAVDHNPRPLGGYTLVKQLKKRIKGYLYAKHIDQFIGVSDYTSDAIIKDFGSFLKPKIKTVYNGLKEGNYEKKCDYNFRFKFLTTSHLREEKGIQDILVAISNMPEFLSGKIKLDIYGSGPYEKTLKEMVKLHSLEKNVFFKGSVENLNEIYKNYDYLIHPSRGETFCFSVLEAVICNLPVITTTKNGNILGLITNEYNGFIYKEKIVSELSKILTEVLQGEKEIKDINNYEISKKYSLDQMVSSYIKLME